MGFSPGAAERTGPGMLAAGILFRLFHVLHSIINETGVKRVRSFAALFRYIASHD